MIKNFFRSVVGKNGLEFRLLGGALEKVLNWPEGSFVRDYKYNREENLKMAMENSPVVVALIEYMNNKSIFQGNFANLYTELERYRTSVIGWPTAAKGLASILKRQVPALAIVGLEIIFDDKRQNNGYHVTIKKKGGNHVHQVHQVHKARDDKEFGGELSAHDEHEREEF